MHGIALSRRLDAALGLAGDEPAADLTFIGVGGHIAGYDVLITGDTIIVSRDGTEIIRHPVPNYGTGICELAQRPGFALGWGEFPDGAQVIYAYDRDDDGFGYAVNITAPDCSEWGYAPFREPVCPRCGGSGMAPYPGAAWDDPAAYDLCDCAAGDTLRQTFDAA